MAVTQVPMLAPKAKAMPAGRVMRPSVAMTITMEVVAEELVAGPQEVGIGGRPLSDVLLRRVAEAPPGRVADLEWVTDQADERVAAARVALGELGQQPQGAGLA